MRRALLLALVPLLAGCSLFDSVGPRVAKLSEQRAKFAALANDTYEFTYHRMCFCAHVDSIRINVQLGEVAGALRIRDGVPLPEFEWPTIEDIFDELETLLRGQYHKLEITYDPEFGFPSFVDYDRSQSIADEEFTLRLTNLSAYVLDGPPPSRR